MATSLPPPLGQEASPAFPYTPQAIASLIEHTLVTAQATRDEIARLCEQAIEYHFAAVCVNPCYVSLASAIVRGSPVRVGTVIGFPLGGSLTTSKRFEASQAVKLGAREIDMVMNIGALKSGQRASVQNDIRSVEEIVHGSGALLKVVLEAGLLTLEEKIVACELCLAAKADYVVACSGFLEGATTTDDIALLRGVVGDRAGVKAAGGIRSAAQVRALLAAGANRLGTSSALGILDELIRMVPKT